MLMIRMGHFKYTLSNIWFWMIIVLTCFLVENVALFTNGVPLDGFSNPIFYLLTFAIIVMLGVYFFLEHRKNKMKVDWVLFSVLFILFVFLTISIWTNASSTTFVNADTGVSSTVTFSIAEKTRYTIELLVSLTVIYALCFAFSKGRLKTRKLMWFAYIVIITVLISLIFSLFYEIQIYKNVFSGSFSGNGAGSFFINPNLFGFCLMLGIMTCFIVNYYHERWWAYLLIFVFFFAMVFTLCNTTLLISALAILIYFIAKIIVSYTRHHAIRATIFLSFFILGITSLVIVFVIGNANHWPIMVAASKFLNRFIFTNNFQNFSGRKNVWTWAIELLDDSPYRLLFGYGYQSSSKLMYNYSLIFNHAYRTCHSGYIEIFFMGGIVGFSIYLLGVVYGIYCLIRLFIKKYFRFSLLYFLLYVCLLTHSLMESTRFFDTSTSGTIIMLLVFLPPVVAWKQIRHPCLVKEAYYNNVWQNSVKGETILRTVSLVLISLILALSMSFLTSIPYTNSLVLYGVVGGIIFCAISLLFLPYFASLLYPNSSNIRLFVRIVIYGIILLGVSGGLSLLLLLVLKWNLFSSIGLGLLTYLILGFVLTNIFMGVYHGNPLNWIKQTIHSLFFTPGLSGPFMIAIGGSFTAIMNILLPMDGLTMLVLLIIDLLIFYLTFAFSPFKDKKQMSEQFNEEGLFNWRRMVIKEKI